MILDVDQHLFESRTAWRDHIDPARRGDALAIEDDALGWPWLTWRGQQLYPVESQRPLHPEEVGEERLLRQKGAPAPASYEDRVPASYTDPAARVSQLDDFGLDASVLFPNLRPHLGGHARRRSSRPVRQPARLQPLVGVHPRTTR